MSVTTYSLITDRRKKLSKDFILDEFACRDGSTFVKVDDVLVSYLQLIRTYFGKPVIITSGYRTPVYNRTVGGTRNSYHTKGQAADIYVKGINALAVARFAKSIGILGIGYYPANGFIHIDTRKSKYYWKVIGNKEISVNSF